jgi:hypothetical protein
MVPLSRDVLWGPMAFAIMGGLVVATVLTIAVRARACMWPGTGSGRPAECAGIEPHDRMSAPAGADRCVQAAAFRHAQAGTGLQSTVFAAVAELVDAPGLGPGAARREGSSPFGRTRRVSPPAGSQNRRRCPPAGPGILRLHTFEHDGNSTRIARRARTTPLHRCDAVRHRTGSRRALRKLSRTVKMPGFRPGKVPMKMIEQSYGPQVHSEVLGDAVSKAFSDAVTEHNLRVAGQPQIEPRQDAAEGEVGFTRPSRSIPTSCSASCRASKSSASPARSATPRSTRPSTSCASSA